MNNKIKIEIALGIILLVAIIIGGCIWLNARNEINLASQQKAPVEGSLGSSLIMDENKKINNYSDLLEILKIKGGVSCEVGETVIITDGIRRRIDYNIKAPTPSIQNVQTTDSKYILLDDGSFTYRWMGKSGDKYKADSLGENAEKFWENNFENLAKDQKLKCRPIELSDADFTPPSDVDFKFVDTSGMNTF